jgi:murein tripeptide amidase MpaA
MIHFDRFYRYDELSRLLQAYAEKFPNLVQLESIGQSYEGRAIWLVTVTNSATGPAVEKPAFWIDGNIHAAEVATSTACLYHLHTLTGQYGRDETITRCLDSRVFYICPRVNPDGAECALADRPYAIRSSTRPYPFDEEPEDGLLRWEDIDGDGRILTMRIIDPNGPWKIHPEEPRLMIRRDPIETGGTYYRLVPEGYLKNYDGVTIKVRRDKAGLDLNRNFPMEWRQEAEQPGAGPYPASEPEVRAVVDFISRHNNIMAVVAFHTMSGVLLRPYASQADDAFPPEDLWTYQKVGQKGTDITGYPNISIFHEFRYHPKQVITGGSDWTYDHLGMLYWAVELWSPHRHAGITDYKYIDWYREHPIEDDLKLLQWNDEKLDGQGYVAWYEVDHPQLGKVELGGWDFIHAWWNPTPALLEDEVKAFPEWLIWQALIAPELVVREASATAIGRDSYRIRLVVDNAGWLPTYVTKKALAKKAVRGVICEISLPDGATLASGQIRQEVGQLEGRAYTSARVMPWEGSTNDRAKVEWVVHAPNGGSVELSARHERAGVVRKTLPL